MLELKADKASQDHSMEDQRTILDQTIESWRRDLEQLDYILVIGRRF
ncbi:MAG: hypothetical protein GY790_16785 [Bacteroidetes bacterium]|nr:hypothetical protein [Bacteroidota bacterium]